MYKLNSIYQVHVKQVLPVYFLKGTSWVKTLEGCGISPWSDLCADFSAYRLKLRLLQRPNFGNLKNTIINHKGSMADVEYILTSDSLQNVYVTFPFLGHKFSIQPVVHKHGRSASIK